MKSYVNRLHTNKDITNTCTIIKQYAILLLKHLTFILLIQYNIHFLIITNPFKSSLQTKEKKRKNENKLYIRLFKPKITGPLNSDIN